LKLEFGGVSVSVVPDLVVEEASSLRLLKLDFSEKVASNQTIRTVSQLLFEAARTRVPGLKASQVRYIDVARGHEHKAARAGARTLREIEDACKNIEQLWPGI
jgi:hypothetical protein